MSTDINCFCITCRETLGNSGATETFRDELEKVKNGDKGMRLSWTGAKRARKCKRAGHDLVWEYI